MNYLKLHLKGVAQHYAEDNCTTLKTTYNTSLVPTKTAMVGLIASAFGYSRGSKEIATLNKNLIAKYQIIKPGVVKEDFQTTNRLDLQNFYTNQHFDGNHFHSIDGTVYDDKTVIKKIQYLYDAEFYVYIGANDELLESIYKALRNPVYSLYLGKRSCVPCQPIVTDFYLIKEEILPYVSECI